MVSIMIDMQTFMDHVYFTLRALSMCGASQQESNLHKRSFLVLLKGN